MRGAAGAGVAAGSVAEGLMLLGSGAWSLWVCDVGCFCCWWNVFLGGQFCGFGGFEERELKGIRWPWVRGGSRLIDWLLALRTEDLCLLVVIFDKGLD